MRKITVVGRARRVELTLRIASMPGPFACRGRTPDSARCSRLLPALVGAFLAVTLMVPGPDVALAQATDEPTPSPTPSEPESRLAFQPDGLGVELKQGESAISTVELAASDDAEVAFTVSDDRRWLQVAPASGTTPQILELTVDAAGIRPGSYTATVEATAEDYEPGTLVVDVIVRRAVTEPDDDEGDAGKPDRKPPSDGDTGGRRPGTGSKGGGGGSGSPDRDRTEASVKADVARGIDPRSGNAYWDLVAECESSGRWDLNSGNGYFGGLQFDRWTWKRHGGREYAPRADLATRRQQITVAKRVGYDAWPNCPYPLTGTFTTARLEAAAARLRALGWDGADIRQAVYAPFIIAGPAAWSDTWGAPRYGPGSIVRSHQGQDVFCDFGTPVLASAEGTIEFDEVGLGGRVARLHRPDGSYFYYGHLLDWNRDDFSDGDRVEPGDVIGYCGNTGNAVSTPPHVHFGWYRADGVAADPMAFLVSWLRAAERRALATVAAADSSRFDNLRDAITARRFGDGFAPDLSEVTAAVQAGETQNRSLFGALIESALHSASAASEAPEAVSLEDEPSGLPTARPSSPWELPLGVAAETEHFGIDFQSRE